LTESGGIGSQLATDALDLYQALDPAGRRAFFEALVKDFSPDPEDVGNAADAYRKDPSPQNLLRLQRVVEPPRQELFRQLNLAPEGTRTLVAMRSHVLHEIDNGADLDPIAADLGHLLTSWFNRGFLTLQRIDWHSSAVVLQKLIEYEAVHQIHGWNDLRRRLEADRRCYAFFHSAMREEPLIFIEVALTRGMSERVQPLLDPESPVKDPASADSAIFYSITNCQDGLRGVPFGSLLVKQVVEDLRSRAFGPSPRCRPSRVSASGWPRRSINRNRPWCQRKREKLWKGWISPLQKLSMRTYETISSPYAPSICSMRNVAKSRSIRWLAFI